MSNSEEFKNGDVVYLKSGSPAMVIDNHRHFDCECLYLSNGEIKTIKINFTSLTKNKPTP